MKFTQSRVFTKTAIMVFMVCFSLTGCLKFNLDTLNRQDLSGNDFNSALAREYRLFSKIEAENADWMDSDYFAKKGLAVLSGEQVLPEDPTIWNIGEEHLGELAQARQQLIQITEPRFVNQHPIKVAQAFVSYDCWVEESEEAWQTEYINSCKEKFYGLYREITGNSFVANEEILPIEDSEYLENMPDIYVVFFGFDKDKLSGDAKNTVKQVARSLEDDSRYTIILNGHSDRAGDEKYNQALSERRAVTVERHLIASGVRAENIEVFSFGEREPARQTADGVQDSANRRVEIIITQ